MVPTARTKEEVASVAKKGKEENLGKRTALSLQKLLPDDRADKVHDNGNDDGGAEDSFPAAAQQSIVWREDADTEPNDEAYHGGEVELLSTAFIAAAALLFLPSTRY